MNGEGRLSIGRAVAGGDAADYGSQFPNHVHHYEYRNGRNGLASNDRPEKSDVFIQIPEKGKIDDGLVQRRK